MTVYNVRTTIVGLVEANSEEEAIGKLREAADAIPGAGPLDDPAYPDHAFESEDLSEDAEVLR